MKSVSSQWHYLRSAVRRQAFKQFNQRAALRRLRLERLEVRCVFASDLLDAMFIQSADDAHHSDVDGIHDATCENLHGGDHGYAEDTRVREYIDDDTHWVMRLDSEAVTELLAAVGPSLLGVFMPQSLSFSSLANGMPILNSLAGSPTSVFLDFDGDVTTDTDPYDVDSNPTTFNAAEQKTIAEAWRQLSTYFAMFDTNVTTVQPPTATPKAWAAVGNNIVGGYSGVSVFPNDRPRSFNQSGDARGRVSGIAHEVGHNFGLSHQSDFDSYGVETRDYSFGWDELHVPIMGVDFGQQIRKWIIGHTANASALQDDVAVITNEIKPFQAAGGDGFRPDDFGGTIASASALASMNDVQYASGIIERLTDVDAFSFAANGQAIIVSAMADFPSGVDLKLEIFDSLGTLVAAKDGPDNDQVISLVLAAGTYYALVSSHGNYGDLGTYNVTVRQLPTNWESQDIGDVGIPGFSQYDSTTNSFLLAGSGADIGGTSDEFQFAYQTLNGDGTIIAKVNSITNTANGAKAGIEIRESLVGGSKHAALVATAANGLRFFRRTTAGGATTTTSTAATPFAPIWLRLVRAGNTITASQSANGTTWTTVGTSTVSMTSKVYVGLAVTAAGDRLFNAAEFEQVTVTGDLGEIPPSNNSLPAPVNVVVSRATGADLAISWSDVSNETGYRIERSIDGSKFVTAATVSANVISFVDTGLVGTMRYFYRVIALDANGGSVPSAIVSQRNRPSAVTRLESTSLDQNRIVLDWIETSGENGYRIERSTDGVAFTTIATVGANVPSYTNTGLTTGSSFIYRVTPTSALGDGPSATIGGATRLAQVPNLVFTELRSNQVGLAWGDIGTETNYIVQRGTDPTATFVDIATLPANTTEYTDTTVSGANEYYYRVVGSNGASISLFNTIFSATPPANPLAFPWTAIDIGTASGAGSTSLSNTGLFKVISSGTGIGSTSDNFRFTSQILDGDGSITARIASLEDTGNNARLGVMIRESLAPGSRFAMTSARPGETLQFLRRSTLGGNTTTTSDIVDNAPVWLRLTRTGNLFTSERSSDGATWNQIGQATISMGTTVYIGLAGTASTTTELNTATADNVSLTGAIRDSQVINRSVFYNRSTSTVFGDGAGNPTGAIDTSRTALLPGQSASASNYTNYSRGLNGILVDITGGATPTVADFQFATWDGIATTGFTATSAVPTITLLAGAGASGSDRVKIEFANNAIQNTWLRINVLANANTGLIANDVFYFGHALADTGAGNIGTPTNVRVNATDIATIRQNQSPNANSTTITNQLDINKDGRINPSDVSIVRQNQRDSIIRFFTAATSLEIADLFDDQDVSIFAIPFDDLKSKKVLTERLF